VKLVFNPNTLAQVAAFAALDDKDHLGSTLENNTFWKLSVEKILEEKEIRYLDSYTNFITLVFDSSQKASAYNEYMDKEGVLLRKLDGFGLSHGVRISIGNPDEMSHCVKCLSNYSIE
jgi:histidinol-phosphate aminotransferase